MASVKSRLCLKLLLLCNLSRRQNVDSHPTTITPMPGVHNFKHGSRRRSSFRMENQLLRLRDAGRYAARIVTLPTNNAIAYLKAAVPVDDPEPVIELSRDDSPVMKDVGGGLLVAYLVDTGDSFGYVQYRDLDADSVTESELHENAVDNLLSLTTTTDLRVAPHGNIFAVLFDGNFEASLILADQLWRESFRQFVTGDYFVAIPNRDILAFCDCSSAVGRSELLQVIDRLRGSADHPISDQLFVRRDNEFHAEKVA